MIASSIKPINSFILGIITSASIISISKIVSPKRRIQTIRHERILYNIQTKLKDTRDEIFIGRYVAILTYARNRFAHDYDQILDDLEFILSYNRPIEKIMAMLATYMIVLDVLYDVECARHGIKFDFMYEMNN